MEAVRTSIVKMREFWDTALCSIVGVDRRFQGAYYLHNQVITLMVEEVRTSETSVYPNETTQRYISDIALIFILAAMRT
jgi:hypothetical protein